MITIKAIAIREKSRAEMQLLESVDVSVAKGLAGDFRGSETDRQVTILSESAWQQACQSIDTELPWTIRRANLLVDGVEFSADDVGKQVRIGELELVITRETDPCSRMDAQHLGLTSALMPDWRGGVCCNVIKPGKVKTGDHVTIA
jgi:MOSC domain-containing protein YiiM